MATLGLMAGWATALFAGWALVAGLAADTLAHPLRRSAERALLASAAAALVATGALAVLLSTGDFTVDYVARSITSNLSAPYRIAALWNLPAGAVLPTAAFVALAGWMASRRTASALSIAAVAAVVVALCAASLAATPFATLPWIPADGLGLRPALQQPLSVVGAVALSLAVAGLAARLATAASALATTTGASMLVPTRRGSAIGDARVGDAATIVVTATMLALAVWSTARGSFEAGVATSPSPLGAGALVAALCAVILAWRACGGGAAPAFAGSLGAVGVVSAVLLDAIPRAGFAWAAAAFPILSMLVATAGAVGAALGERVALRRAFGVLAALSLGAAGVAELWLTVGGGAAFVAAAQWALVCAGLAIVVAERVAERVADADSGRVGRWMPMGVGVASGAVALVLTPPSTIAIGWSLLAGASVGLAIARLHPYSLERVRGAIVAGALACASLAAAGEGWGSGEAATVAGGGTLTVAAPIGAPFILAHQGISRYEDGNAHVEALAIDVSRNGDRLALLSTDRREYVDGRDELLGPATRRPALLGTWWQELSVHLDDVATDERATLRLAVVPLALAWRGALGSLLLLSATLLVRRRARGANPASTDIASA